MKAPTHVSESGRNLTLSPNGFPRLSEQLARLEAQGVDTKDPSLWHPNALLVAADLMGIKDDRAVAVNRNASMLLASLLTLKDEESEPTVLQVRHVDGAKARITLAFEPRKGDEQVSRGACLSKDMSPPTADNKRIWVARESVEADSIDELVRAMARAAGSAPGGLVSLVGAGAVLACIQSMEAMNAAKASFAFEGLGDAQHEFEFVGLEIAVEPSLSPTPSAARPSM